uniref:FAD-binding PCMH-type domain-containing protein n=1 Tax=Moniliophthora roreri TaxID=221103 RepID=A0A0W0FNV8_MONRR
MPPETYKSRLPSERHPPCDIMEDKFLSSMSLQSSTSRYKALTRRHFDQNLASSATRHLQLLAALLSAKLAHGGPNAACNALQSALPGRVFFPGTEEYLNDNGHYTRSASESSTCSVQPESVEDVGTILQIVANGGTQSPFAIKGGGHTGNLGFSSTPGYFHSEDWRRPDLEVYARLVSVGGRVPGVGVGGLSLGGGYRFFTDQYGLSVDTIISHDLVLPNGTFIGVTNETDPDLFFALKASTRGGGFNNFGIVTSFTMQAFPQTDVWVSAVPSHDLNWSANNSDMKATILSQYLASSANETSIMTSLFYDGPMPPNGIFDEFLNIPGSTIRVSGTMSLPDAMETLNGRLGNLNPPSNRSFVSISIMSQPFAQPNVRSTDSAYPPGRFVCPSAMESHSTDEADDAFFFGALFEAQRAIQA